MEEKSELIREIYAVLKGTQGNTFETTLHKAAEKALLKLLE